jgi:hypothetical protein
MGESFDGAPSVDVAALERRIDRYFVGAAIHQQRLAGSFEENKRCCVGSR